VYDSSIKAVAFSSLYFVSSVELHPCTQSFSLLLSLILHLSLRSGQQLSLCCLKILIFPHLSASVCMTSIRSESRWNTQHLAKTQHNIDHHLTIAATERENGRLFANVTVVYLRWRYTRIVYISCNVCRVSKNGKSTCPPEHDSSEERKHKKGKER